MPEMLLDRKNVATDLDDGAGRGLDLRPDTLRLPAQTIGSVGV